MKKSLVLFTVLLAMAAQAEEMDRPGGIKIGQRMTIRPYVSLGFTHDSNVDSSKHSKRGESWTVQPGASLEYKAENWALTGSAYYSYHAYSSGYSHQQNESSYGEQLNFNWSNSSHGSKGWSLLLTESYRQISQDDDMSNDGGRGTGRDREQLDVGGSIEHRFTDRLHAAVNASYYYLDYDNKVGSYAPMYGWDRWTAGGEIGYAASKWTDFILAGSYQDYTSDNGKQYYVDNASKVRNSSKGYTVQAGLGSYATERISYRVLVGYAHYDYNDDSENAPVYTASLNWKMTDNWNMMALASRYYQPSETSRGSSQLTDAISWGVAHSMIRGKLNATFDLAYRRQDTKSTVRESVDYTQDIATARFGLNYSINRFIGVFGSVEFQQAWYDGGNTSRDDYNRWRGTVGMRLSY